MSLTHISTAGVKDDAVTSGKIPANAVGSSELADNAVDTAAIANNAVSTDKIADDAIRSRHYGDNSIDTAFIANNAVTTAKIADDAITGAKIATDAVTSDSLNGSAVGTSHLSDNAVATAKIASEAVTTAKIADQAVTLAKLPHGTSSNDGKFLRANNGADPTFETVTGTTINNNADNRVITGSGTANTLEGEANLTYDGSKLTVQGDSGLVVQTSTAPASNTDPAGEIFFNNSSNGNVNAKIVTFRNTGTSGGDLAFFTRTHGDGTNQEGEERMRIDSSGRVLIGTTTEGESGADELTIENTSADNGITLRSSSSNSTNIFFSDGTSGVAEYAGYIQYTHSQDALHLGTASTRRIRVDSDGLKFGTDTAAANALDDYEIGTWSPFTSTQISTHSISIPAQAHYVKIGRLCHVWMRISFSSSNNTAIEGNMPFPCSNPTSSGSDSPFFLPVFPRTNATPDMGFAYLGSNGTTGFTIYQSNANYATFNFNSGLGQITINGSYRTT